MSVALVLFGYALVLGTVVAWLLHRSAWVNRAPRLAIAAWQAVSLSLVSSLVLAGLALAVPISRISGDLAELLEACVMAVRAQYATPGGAIVGTIGALLAAGIAGRAALSLFQTLRTVGKERRAHLEVLALLGRQDTRIGAVILDHERPAAYCLPGRRGRIVLTTAALRALGDTELRAVLAHEQAHLRARHDLAIASATALTRAFPGIWALRTAADEIARLAELAADDTASRTTSPLAMAEALLAVAGGDTPPPMPAPALGAANTDTCRRIRRLLAPRSRLGPVGTILVAGLAVTVLALPVGIAAQPALAARTLDYCPVAATP